MADEAVDTSTGTETSTEVQSDSLPSAQDMQSQFQAGGEEAAPEGQPSGEQPTGWESQALPEGHWGTQKGWKTWGDVDKGYRSSSEEVRRAQALNDHYRETFGKLKPVLDQYLNSRAQPAAPVNGNQQGYYGHESKEEFDAWFKAQYAKDPIKAMADVQNLRLKHDPAYRAEFHKQHIDPALAETRQSLQDQRFNEHLQASARDFFTRHPDVSDTRSPVNQAMTRWMESRGWDSPQGLAQGLQALKAIAPGMNFMDFVHSQVMQGVTQQQVKAQAAKLEVKAKGAGTARPGTGGRSVSKAVTPEEQLAVIAQDLRANGQDVPDDWLNRWSSAMERERLND